MVVFGSLVSTVVMGVLLVAIVIAVAKGGSPRGAWIASHRRYLPGGGTLGGVSGPSGTDTREVADDIGLWIAAFLVLAFGFGLVALLFVGWYNVGISESFGGVVVGLFALLLTLYLGLGVYYTARSRGHPYSMAAAQAVTVLSLMVLLVIAVRLVRA